MRLKRVWIIVLILAILAAGLWSLTVIKDRHGDPLLCTSCWIGGHHHHASEGRTPSSGLRMLASAQAYFRANDLDKDGVNQFWRADVAGLYALAPGGGPAIKLIELRVAAADDRSLHLGKFAVPAACTGYWYRAIRHADEDPKALDPNRFAYCAYPDSVGAGRYLYIIDEDYTVFRADAGGRRGIEVYPTEEELRTSWSKLD